MWRISLLGLWITLLDFWEPASKFKPTKQKGNVQFEKTEIDLYFPNQKTESFSFSNIDGTLNWQKNNLEGLTIFAERLEGFFKREEFSASNSIKEIRDV